MSENTVSELAHLLGIWSDYQDAFGVRNTPPPETARAILNDFGLPTGTEADARDSLERARRVLAGPLPPLLPVTAGVACRLPVQAAPGETLAYSLTDEAGVTTGARAVVEAADGGCVLTLPLLETGYYRMALRIGGTTCDATVIAAPARAYDTPQIAAGARLWGTTAQVYGLRSHRDFGSGDFTDVAMAAAGTGRLGGSFLGLSPLHALFSGDRDKISPYSPSSRLFIDPMFIDPTAVEGFGGSSAAAMMHQSAMHEAILAQRHAPLVDAAGVWAIKEPLLRALWRETCDASRDKLARFRQRQGDLLTMHATFEAIFAARRAKGEMWMGEWPAELRVARSDAVGAFQAAHADEVDFYAWLQWQADRQFDAAGQRARDSGMSIGLYRDLAVGADRGGSEVWTAPERFGPTLSVGAPPDPIAPNGQNWGLPPFDPLALATTGLAALRALVAANMRHSGAIRIDHAFQLQRLFLIPQGARSSEGTYVNYPLDAMLAVLRLESHRHRALVIAEDLGNGPPGFSERIMAEGIFSYRVMSFEREHDGAFRRPGHYPERALSVITTHDLPTLKGWWRGRDIDLRESLALFDPDKAAHARHERGAEIGAFRRALAEERLEAGAEQAPEPPLDATMRYLARTRSALMGVQLEDAEMDLEQANLPGLERGHPNWRRKLAQDIETLTGPGGGLARVAADIAAEGRGEPDFLAPNQCPPR